jgi:hypothetical protein
VKIIKAGEVVIRADGSVEIGEGFEFDHSESSHIAWCRSVALLASLWAIERLTEETRKTVEAPGGGRICV